MMSPTTMMRGVCHPLKDCHPYQLECFCCQANDKHCPVESVGFVECALASNSDLELNGYWDSGRQCLLPRVAAFLMKNQHWG